MLFKNLKFSLPIFIPLNSFFPFENKNFKSCSYLVTKNATDVNILHVAWDESILF